MYNFECCSCKTFPNTATSHFLDHFSIALFQHETNLYNVQPGFFLSSCNDDAHLRPRHLFGLCRSVGVGKHFLKLINFPFRCNLCKALRFLCVWYNHPSTEAKAARVRIATDGWQRKLTFSRKEDEGRVKY